jgi:tRNA 2-selenouridine synthase
MPDLQLWPAKNFRQLFTENHTFIDVRAPIEFTAGHIPGSINLPILFDEERAAVGAAYKQQGQDAAIKLGHSLVSGRIKEARLGAWLDYLRKNPKCLITCFRGGLRSKIAQGWCAEAGVPRARIEGGYKALRQFLLDEIEIFSAKARLLVVSGATGAGKTLLLRDRRVLSPKLDLELYANHRGSAFGGFGSQPSQIDFENTLARAMLLLNTGAPVLVEDESRLIGRCVQPDSLFSLLRRSPAVIIDEPLSIRVENTFQEYIVQSALKNGDLGVFDSFMISTKNISRKLGGARAQEVLQDISFAKQVFIEKGDLQVNRLWIEKLLKWYYDPMYLGSLESRKPKILFSGTRLEVINFLGSTEVSSQPFPGSE